MRIHLRKSKEAAVRRRHPWVFSGAIYKTDGKPTEGDIVSVYAATGELLGRGHYQRGGSISVRLLAFEDVELDEQFWVDRIQAAYNHRRNIGLLDRPDTTAYRLVHAEGDSLPGLIIDIYGGTAVLQCHSVGMLRQRDLIVSALRTVYGETLQAVYDKSREVLAREYAKEAQNTYLYGSGQPGEVLENGHRFYVDWETGQKTGFFLDQRDNRALLARYAPGRKVLNTFCYSGGFSVYAVAAGAELVHSVDASARAIDWTERNIALNQSDTPIPHEAHVSDVLKYLKSSDTKYDLMVVDPPAYAKHIRKRHNAVQGYKRLNAEAMRHLPKGGILFTFSCSQVIDRPLFYNTIVAAALEVGREARVLHHLSQPPDHPVSLFHPEGSYLKGLVVAVE